MGALCNCNAKQQNQTSMFQSFQSTKDPRLADLYTHLKILDAKLNSNITAIDDFRQLLIETKKEVIPHKDISIMITAIDDALEEAKTSLQQVVQKRNLAKQMMESADTQLSLKLQRPPDNKSMNDLSIGGSKFYDGDDVDRGSDSKTAIEEIYKKISDMLKLLRKGEEDAQVQMLKWENFVIQHEKMKILREDINESFKTDGDKIVEIEKKQKELKEMLGYFLHVVNILDQCQTEAQFALNNGSLREDENSLDVLQQSSSMLKDSFEDEMREEEMEQLSELRDQVLSYQIKLDQSERHMEKFKYKLKANKQKREEINEFDIYELDSFFKKQQDFLNNLEICLYKINDMLNELKKKYNDGHNLLDICELIYMRKDDVKYCISIITKTEKQYNKLISESQVLHYHHQQNGGSVNQMLQKTSRQRRKIQEQMETHLTKIQRMENIVINMNDLEQIEQIMVKLSFIQKDCNDSLQSIFEEYILGQKLLVINGRLGWKIEIQQYYQKLTSKVSKVRRAMNLLSNDLIFQQEKCSDILNNNLTQENEDVLKKNEIERLQKRIQALTEKHKILYDQMMEVETNLDRWYSLKTGAHMCVLEGVDIDEQEWQVQEFINVMTQIANLKFFSDKIQSNIEKNHRQVRRIEIQVYSQNAMHLRKSLFKQIDATKDLASKVEHKVNQFKSLMVIYQPNNSQFFSSSSNNTTNKMHQLFNSDQQTQQHEIAYEDQSKSLTKLNSLLQTSTTQALNANEYVKLLNEEIKQRIQSSANQYQLLFEDQEALEQLREKAKNNEVKFLNLFKQVKSINSELHEIFSHFSKHDKSGMNSSQLQLTYGRQQSIGSDSVASMINTMNNQVSTRAQTNKLQLNTTLGEDDPNRSQIALNVANLDDIDHSLYKCIEEQKCFKNINIEKIKKGLYKLENREFYFKILQGNNLAIRMFAGYIFTDCLVHFDEELMHLVRN